VVAVIKSLGQEKAIVVGHDWGGAVAWQVALNVPQVVDRLIILNLPHPRGLSRELAHNPDQQKNSSYARNFQKPEAAANFKIEQWNWVKDPDARVKWLEAMKRSDLEGMLNYYKRNYPREPYTEDTSAVNKTQMPVLMIHGLGDTALLSGALNNTWDWMGKDLTLVTIPGSGHFVQQDASDLVSRTMRAWLLR
jgi:pimeloyl-ACP methyl ester carboxylesterase